MFLLSSRIIVLHASPARSFPSSNLLNGAVSWAEMEPSIEYFQYTPRSGRDEFAGIVDFT